MASSSDEEEANNSERFDNLCHELNMDEETSKEAWCSYEKICTNYTLEVSFTFCVFGVRYMFSSNRNFRKWYTSLRVPRALVLRSDVSDKHIFNNQTIFLSGGQSTLAGMCFIRRLPQKRCSDR